MYSDTYMNKDDYLCARNGSYLYREWLANHNSNSSIYSTKDDTHNYKYFLFCNHIPRIFFFILAKQFFCYFNWKILFENTSLLITFLKANNCKKKNSIENGSIFYTIFYHYSNIVTIIAYCDVIVEEKKIFFVWYGCVCIRPHFFFFF